MEVTHLHTFIQAEERLEQAKKHLTQAAEELAFMEIIGRAERLELPRLTPLNQPMVERALTASKEQQAETHAVTDLQRAVDYYQTLSKLNDTVALLEDKIRSTQLTLGARIYKRSRRIFSTLNRKNEEEPEPIFFPLQAQLAQTQHKQTKKPIKNEVIPIADIEGI